MSGHVSPRVTVFMPVYNREHTLREAIDSVLGQTYPNFELLLVDDGSSDGSLDIVHGYRDSRVRLVVHERNLGIPATRNHGLELARGELLALLDSDDVATPTRLRRQVDFLDRRPDVAAVGSWLTKIDASGRTRGFITRPTRPLEIRAHILFVSCFKNPAMMARTEILRRFGYREEFRYCQDIDLWARVSARHALANIPRFLTRYRSGGESRRDEDLALRLKMAAARYQLVDFGIDFDEEDLARHVQLRNVGTLRPDAEFVSWCEDWLQRILAHNARHPSFPEPHLAHAATERWLLVALRALATGSVPIRRLARGRFLRRAPGCVGRQTLFRLGDTPAALASLFG
jgi:glycosyltransferase involved in cell wall biosynthesis